MLGTTGKNVECGLWSCVQLGIIAHEDPDNAPAKRFARIVMEMPVDTCLISGFSGAGIFQLSMVPVFHSDCPYDRAYTDGVAEEYGNKK